MPPTRRRFFLICHTLKRLKSVRLEEQMVAYIIARKLKESTASFC